MAARSTDRGGRTSALLPPKNQGNSEQVGIETSLLTLTLTLTVTLTLTLTPCVQALPHLADAHEATALHHAAAFATSTGTYCN